MANWVDDEATTAEWGETSEDFWKVQSSSTTWAGDGNVLADKTNRDINTNGTEQDDTSPEIGLEGSKYADEIICRNCQQPGHVLRECPEPKKMTGECFNCGEVGHNKADCPNPKVERPFTGECFNCGEVGHSKAGCPNPKVERPFTGECNHCKKEGHRAAECPDKPPETCLNCRREGHKAAECTAPRSLENSDIPNMEIDAAWELLKQASKDRDIDDFKTAVKIYAKADASLSYADLERKIRDANFTIYIIGLDKELPKTLTNVDLQGKTGCKYTVGYFYGPKPKRPFMAQWWPASPDDNLERLKDTGETMDSLVPVCRNCNEQGHISKDCTQDKVESGEPITITCTNCKEEGHRLRDCPKERVQADLGLCRNCNQPGHKAVDCTEPRSAANVECRRCGEMGHFSKECPNNAGGGSRACRNCGEEGHIAKECEKPRNPATTTCRNCDEVGHFSRDCPQPKDWSRVKCQNCGEMGHGIKKCPQATADANTTGDGIVEDAFGNPSGDNDNANQNGATEAWATGGGWEAEVVVGEEWL